MGDHKDVVTEQTAWDNSINSQKLVIPSRPYSWNIWAELKEKNERVKTTLFLYTKIKTEGYTLTVIDGLKRFGINGYNRIQCRHLLLFPNIDYYKGNLLWKRWKSTIW